MRINWMGRGGLSITCLCLVVAACSDDGPAQKMGSSDDAGGAPAVAGASGGEAPATEGATGGLGGAGNVAGGGVSDAGGVGDGGIGGVNGAEAAAGTGGDASWAPQHLDCPEIGTPVTISPGQVLDESQLALANAFYCDVYGDNLTFTVQRLALAQESVVTVWSSHDLFELYDRFKLLPDCSASGTVVPGAAASYTGYPDMISQRLPAGTYTLITCESHAEYVVETPPAAPANVDCAHAAPIDNQWLAETRILDAPRFYSFTVPEEGAPLNRAIRFDTPQTNATIGVVLNGSTNGYHAEDELPYAIGDATVSFANLPAGDYCLEVSADIGTRYSIRVGF